MVTDDTARRPEPDRRLAAILVADVVGYSKMIGEDEAGAIERLDASRRDILDPAMARFRGRVFRQVGDGLLVVFPSAVLALRAALQIQEQAGTRNAARPSAERIMFRIGLHQGEVLVQGSNLVGDAVNVAARLEPLARAGGICVSHRIREDAMGKLALTFEDLGERQLKNIGHPVRVFNVHPPRHGVGGTVPAAAPALSFGVTHRLVLPTIPGLPATIQVVEKEPVTFGRLAPPSDLALPDREISRQHCRFELVGGEMLLTDLDSTNGTYVDDRLIDQPTKLHHGARVRLGSYALDYEREEEADSDRTLARRPAGMPYKPTSPRA